LIAFLLTVLSAAHVGCEEAHTAGEDAVAAVVAVAANRAAHRGTTVLRELYRPRQFYGAKARRCIDAKLVPRYIPAALRGILGQQLPRWWSRGVVSFDDVRSLQRVGASGRTVQETWAKRGLREIGRLGRGRWRLVFFSRRRA
jgi:hypothetical protein